MADTLSILTQRTPFTHPYLVSTYTISRSWDSWVINIITTAEEENNTIIMHKLYIHSI